MGGCCSCCSCSSNDDSSTTKETEMSASGAPSAEAAKSLSISKAMSAPTIKVMNGSRTRVSGHGLALATVPIEQDAAYWEWHVVDIRRKSKDGNESDCKTTSPVEGVMFGVSSKKTREFYKQTKDSDKGDEKDDDGTKWMRKIELHPKDVVGVAVQQSDLPMVQFLLNGEPLHEIAINRFRGTAHPAIRLPDKSANNNDDDDIEVIMDLVLIESNFQQMSPGARFGPIIVARSIV